ncbi:MAG: hypothetical protein JNJ64_13500 [Flavobacteriales bacterium]|nr:hypothetical protein [Flavobacteriales bacterium]
MHKVIRLLLATVLLGGPFTSVRSQPGYITLRGDQFYDEHGVPFFPMQMNLYVDSYSPIAPLSPNPSAAEMATVEFGRYLFHSADGDLFFDFPLGQGAASVLQDLNEFKALGFNTIRYVQSVIKKPNEPGFTWVIKPFPYAYENSYVNMDPPYSADPNVNPVSAAFFDMIFQVCSLANSIGMKVSLEPVLGLALLGSSPGDAINLDHLDFLQALGSYIHQQQVHNLLAYEFYGEPSLAAYTHSIQRTKLEVCDLVTSWHETMKTADPDHLTTVGSGYVREVMKHGWDPMTIPVDYVNIHPYPEINIYEDPNTYLSNVTTRYLNWIRYYDRFLKKPYIIGETGFSGEDPYSPPDYTVFNPYLHYPLACYGDEQDQDDFFRNTFAPIRDSRCAGYGIWIFHNMWLEDPNANNTDPTNPSYIPLPAFKERYFGLLRFGDADPIPPPGASGWEAHRKIAAQTFADWSVNPPPHSPLDPLPASLDMNDRYFNPYMHPPNAAEWPNSGGAPWNFGTHYGRMVDQQGKGIAGAIVIGTSRSSQTVYHDYYTFTDDEGYYEIRGLDLIPGFGPGFQTQAIEDDPLNTHDRTIQSLEVGAYASGWDGYGWAGPSFTQPLINCTLKTLQSAYDVLLNGWTVPSGQAESFQGLSTLVAQDMTVQGTLDLKARYEVRARPEFHALLGSECHLYTEPLDLTCTEIDGADLRTPEAVADPGSYTHTNGPSRSIPLTFHLSSPKPRLLVSPNPAHDEVAILIADHGRCSEPWMLQLLDEQGRTVRSQPCTDVQVLLDLTELSPGAYSVVVRVCGTELHERIIKS